MSPFQNVTSENVMEQLMGDGFANRLEVLKRGMMAQDSATQKEIQDYKELGQAVFDNPKGREFIKRLAGYTLSRPVYPPPAGQDAGEYAAQRAGQTDIVAVLATFLES